MRKWLSENKQYLKAIVWSPGLKFVWIVYGLLAFIATFIVWVIPTQDQPRIEYVKLLTWRVWIVLIPILTFILVALVVNSAIKVIASQTSEPMSKVLGPAPNIVCLGDDDLFVDLDRHEIFREVAHHEYALRAITVKFINEPNPPQKVGSVSNVQARILYYRPDFPDRVEPEVHYACWLNQESSFVSFDVNKVHHLIIGTFQLNPEGGYANYFTFYENNLDTRKPLSKCIYQHCEGFRVKVKLVAGEHGEFGREEDLKLILMSVTLLA